MICNSYNQLTIIEKTQFIGKLMHLIQSEESAFLLADNLLRKADSEGTFNKVVILPDSVPEPIYEDAPASSQNVSHNSFEMINSSDFFASNSNNPMINLLHKTKGTFQKSYQRVFAKLAS